MDNMDFEHFNIIIQPIFIFGDLNILTPDQAAPEQPTAEPEPAPEQPTAQLPRDDTCNYSMYSDISREESEQPTPQPPFDDNYSIYSDASLGMLEESDLMDYVILSDEEEDQDEPQEMPLDLRVHRKGESPRVCAVAPQMRESERQNYRILPI